MPEPRKHHFVPQFLLRGFGDEAGRLVVHRVHGNGSYTATVRDIGHQNDGHALRRRDGTLDRTSLEQSMGQVESAAAAVMSQLVDGAELDADRQSTMAWFLALQWHRSRYLLDAVAASLDHEGFTAQEIQTSILQVALVPFFSAWQYRNDETADPKSRWDSIVADTGSFDWSLCRFRRDSLVLGDQTLCLWGVRPGGVAMVNKAWARHGIGVGWGDVARVTVPLAPKLGLLLTRPGAPTRLAAPAFNRATVYNARRFVVHAPTWGEGRPALVAEFDDALQTQRWLAPTFYRNQF